MWRVRNFIAKYGTSIPIMFLGVVILVFLLNVNAQQIPLVQQGGPQAEAIWDKLTNILIVVASAFLSIGGMMIGNTIQDQNRRQQEVREFRRRISQEYRDYLTWLLKLGQHAEFVEKTPKLREKLPDRGHKFDITPEVRAVVIEKMPLAWQFSTIYDNGADDVQKAVDQAINKAFDFLSVSGNSASVNYDHVKQSYDIAMRKLAEYEYKM